jgi:hypothetical protein
MERKPQTLSNHGKLDELFHFFLLPIGAFNLIAAVVLLVRDPGYQTAWITVLSAAFAVCVFRVRTYPLRVQDRVIRLEERMRLIQLLPEPLRSRIGELTESQLVGLRFASDAELPSLVEKTLANNLSSKQIKQAIVNWRPDYFRV